MYKLLTTDNGVTVDETPIEQFCVNAGLPYGTDEIRTGKAILRGIAANLRRQRYHPIFINNETAIRYTIEQIDELGGEQHTIEVGITA